MNAIAPTGTFHETPSEAARWRFLAREGKPLLLADWERALFIHFEMPPQVLQRHVPFELGLFEGRAFVSLVAFTMRGMRLVCGGRFGRWLCAPLGEQRFLNVRTYVRHGGETGIHFLTEWISHALCVPFGPITYGLPYRWGRHAFDHGHVRGELRGRIEARRGGGAMEYEAQPADGKRNWCFDVPAAGSLDEFLIERYVAFTQHRRLKRHFRIWHEPWRTATAEASLIDDSLLRLHLPWWSEVHYAGASYSPGAFNIWMGRPRALTFP